MSTTSRKENSERGCVNESEKARGLKAAAAMKRSKRYCREGKHESQLKRLGE